MAQAHNCTRAMGALGKRQQRLSHLLSAGQMSTPAAGPSTEGRRLPRATRLNISSRVPSNSNESKNYAHLLSDTRHPGKPKAHCFYLYVHTVRDETPLVTALQAAEGGCVRPHRASAGRAVLSTDTNPPPQGGQWQGGTCPGHRLCPGPRLLDVFDSRFLTL